MGGVGLKDGVERTDVMMSTGGGILFMHPKRAYDGA